MKPSTYLRLKPSVLDPLRPETKVIEWGDTEPMNLYEFEFDRHAREVIGHYRVVFDFTDRIVAIQHVRTMATEFVNLPWLRARDNRLYNRFFELNRATP